MPEGYEVVELDPQKRSCQIICVSRTRDTAERIVNALLLAEPEARLHINRCALPPIRRRIREKGVLT